jgi:hypothetical protein
VKEKLLQRPIVACRLRYLLWRRGKGPATKFEDQETANFDPDRELSFRYAIFGHQTNARVAVNDCTATIAATDNCDPSPKVTLLSIASNELESGFLGSGDEGLDIQGAEFLTDDGRSRCARSVEPVRGTRDVYKPSHTL